MLLFVCFLFSVRSYLLRVLFIFDPFHQVIHPFHQVIRHKILVHGTKTVTTGEGGMFVTSDGALFERVLTLSNHGRVRGQSKQFWSDMVGFKYKISNIQAAIGCAQLERIDELIDRKREILATYQKHLIIPPGIKMNPEPKGTTNGAWMPTVVFDKNSGVRRGGILKAFECENIDARVFFWPLSQMEMFDSVETNTNAWDIPARAINLPSFHDMTEDDIHRVISVITKLVQ